MTPVVVVGGVLTALGVVRSLASAGIPVYLASDTRFCPAGLSRQCTLLRVPDLKGQGLVDGLLSIAGRIGEKAVLILSSDLQVVAVSGARAALEAHYFLALPTETMVDVLMDKAKFQAYAEEIGLPVPRAVVLDEGADEQALDVLSMPVVLKPVDRALVVGGVERTTRADTLAEARAVARRMRRAPSSVVVQEWIDGDDDDIYFTLFVCDGQARIVALFTGRKMICAPPLVGSTALCVAATRRTSGAGRADPGLGDPQPLSRHRRARVQASSTHRAVRRRRADRRSRRLAGRDRNPLRREHSGHRVPDSAGRARRDRRSDRHRGCVASLVQVPPSRGYASTWHANSWMDIFGAPILCQASTASTPTRERRRLRASRSARAAL